MADFGQFWTRTRVRAGYPLALVYLWLAKPTPRAIAIGGAVAIVGLLIRGLAAGHLRKGESLATGGPYAYTRNPLYLGSAFLVAGFAVAAHSRAAAAVIVIYFVVFYSVVMKREEAELVRWYGREFTDYAARVPLFFPGLRRAASPAGANSHFSWALYRRNREYQAALGFLVAIALVVLRMLWRS